MSKTLSLFGLAIVCALMFISFGSPRTNGVMASDGAANAREAACRQIDVPVDEGYGVSPHQLRVNCKR
jgi:hypothetical protein